MKLCNCIIILKIKQLLDKMRTQNWAIREEQDGAERTRRSGAENEKMQCMKFLENFLKFEKMKNWIKNPLHEDGTHS